MSKLMKMIKELSGKQVDTAVYLKNRAVTSPVGNHDSSKEEQRLWSGPDSGELKDIIIGGYSGSSTPYGVGPTRLVQYASYNLQLFVVKKDADLVKWCISTSQVDSMIDEIRRRAPFDSRYNAQPRLEEDHLMLASGCILKAGVGFRGIITNVHKQGLNYKGDLSLLVTKQTVNGYRFDDSQDAVLTTMEALSGREKSGNYIPGNQLQNYVLKSKEQLNSFADTFNMNQDYKIWLLMVDNLN